MQSQKEAHASNKKDGTAWLAGPRAGGSILSLCGLNRHQILLLPRHSQDSGKHLWHVRAAGVVNGLTQSSSVLYGVAHMLSGETKICMQDFEALTPNLLARTIETVEGGGIVVLLLSTLTSLTQLFSLTMDVHSRLRTESHQDVTGEYRIIHPSSTCLYSL